MLSQRVKAAVIFVPLVLAMIYFGGWAFNGFITLVLLLAALEYSRVFGKLGIRPFTPLLLAGVLLFLLQRWFFPGEGLGILLSGLITLAALTALIQYESGVKEAAAGFTANLAGMLFLGWGVPRQPGRGASPGPGWGGFSSPCELCQTVWVGP